MVWPLIAYGALKPPMIRSADALQHRVVGRDGGHHGELVAAEPRHDVLGPHGVGQPQRHVADQLVADRMAERVVDVLEVVEVDVEHRGGRAALA